MPAPAQPGPGSTRRLTAAGWLLWLALAASATAQQTFGTFHAQGNTGPSIEVISDFSAAPPGGHLPVRVISVNNGPQPVRWTLRFEHGSRMMRASSRMTSEFVITAAPGESATSRLLVPLAVGYHTGGHLGSHPVSLRVQTRGAAPMEAMLADSVTAAAPAVAMSKSLAAKSLTALGDELRRRHSHHGGEVAAVFSAQDLPDEWLGFSGFDVVMLTDDEWLKLPSAVRGALVQWMRLGGELEVHTTEPLLTLDQLGLPASSPALPVQILPWNGDALDAGPTLDRLTSRGRHVQVLLTSFDHPAKWGLLAKLGERSFAGWQVILFLFIFGALIGPVNLFWLAPVGRRHRLFITTPLISLGASLLLVGVIMVQDGTGGTGHRLIAAEIHPAEASVSVVQEQVSRTGVLLASTFELPPSTQIQQVVTPDNEWAALRTDRGGFDVAAAGRRHSGDWFQSRSEQGQLLRMAAPTRGRIEWLPPSAEGGPPQVMSTLEVPLRRLWLRDDAGKLWKSPAAVSQGAAVTLVPAGDDDLREWKLAAELAHEALEQRLVSLPSQPLSFAALAAEGGEFAAPTLESIRWEDTILLHGPVLPGSR